MAHPVSLGPRDDHCTDLSMAVERPLLPRFYPILQGGFLIRVRVGTGIGPLLREQLALSDGFISERISTVFLDGMPVDDLDRATIREGSTLALSSAMPGLVGATMRRQGFYASFRGSITYREEDGQNEVREGLLCVKVFNLLMADLGPLFLEKGMYLPSPEVEGLMATEPDRFFDGIREAKLNGEVIPPSSLKKRGAMPRCDWTHLVVCAYS